MKSTTPILANNSWPIVRFEKMIKVSERGFILSVKPCTVKIVRQPQFFFIKVSLARVWFKEQTVKVWLNLNFSIKVKTRFKRWAQTGRFWSPPAVNREPSSFASFRHILRLAIIWSKNLYLVPYIGRAGNRFMRLTEVNGSGLTQPS